jgi:hypothetical protein
VIHTWETHAYKRHIYDRSMSTKEVYLQKGVYLWRYVCKRRMPGREAYLGENQAWEKGRLGEEYAWKSISVRELHLEESDTCKSPMPLRESMPKREACPPGGGIRPEEKHVIEQQPHQRLMPSPHNT